MSEAWRIYHGRNASALVAGGSKARLPEKHPRWALQTSFLKAPRTQSTIKESERENDYPNKAAPMDRLLLESKSRWDGDSYSEWMNLAVEVPEIGTWEFDLDQGTGFISQRCSEIMGFPKTSGSQAGAV